MKRITHRLLLCLLVVGLGSTVGCSFDPPINRTDKWSLGKGDMKFYVEETEPGSQRKVNISMDPTPKDANVAVALVWKEDFDAAKAAMKKGDEPPQHLRYHPGGGAVKFEPTVLAKGKSFAVIVKNSVDEPVDIVLKISAK
jgi:hypothetical protein